MSSRVLRSATRTLKRTITDSQPSKVIETTTIIKKVKRVSKPKSAVDSTEAEVKLEPIIYYKKLIIPDILPQLPENFVKAHDPHFIKGLEFLIQKDPSFHQYIVKAPFPAFVIEKAEIERDDHYYFESLISGIISQQISGKAAKAIKQRLIDNLSTTERLPSLKIFANTPIEILRSCGLSERKLQYVTLIAVDFDNKKLGKESLEQLSDEEIYNTLIEYKGIGPWSVVMFLLFSLKRLNVFTHTDLGVLRGASRYLNERVDLLQQVKRNTVVKSKKKEFKNRKWVAVNEECVETLSKEFQPYMSCLMLVFWRMSDIDIDALEN